MIPEPAEEAEPLHRAARFERHAGFYGVPAAALDQVFAWRGSAYRLSGCSARRCKFPFAAERVSDGKLVKFPCKVVRAAFLAVSGGGPGTNADEDSRSGIEGGPCPSAQ
jgi:hypothetical protein